MRILVTGGQGQLARALGMTLEGAVLLSKQELNISDMEALEDALEKHRPEVVINTAAMTDVDLCEDEPERAFLVNGIAPGWLGEMAHRFGFILLQISTDYVFSGKKGEPYTEKDCPSPISVYGNSKLVGENLIKASMERFYIVRTSGLYGPGGRNFVKAVLEKARKGEKLRVVKDRFSSPTYTLELARQIRVLIEKSPPFGIYHAVNHGAPSWYDFAKKALEYSGLPADAVEPIASEDFPQRARRPAFSALKNEKLESLGLDFMSDWSEALKSFIEEYKP